MKPQAMMEFIKRFFDLNDKTWAPKSTRIWRLQQYEYPGGEGQQQGA